MMAAELPERIEIEVIADGKPLPGGLADVSLSMTSKNPHTMVLGPADGRGRIIALRSELLDRAARNCCSFVMDYSDPTEHFGGTVEVKPATPIRVREMQKAYREFSPFFEYPVDWPTVLGAAARWFEDNPAESISVRVTVFPAHVQVKTPEVTL